MKPEERLVALVAGSPWLVAVLDAVRAAGFADAWVGAGVLRDLVWGETFGTGFDPDRVRDVDVAFFAPDDLDCDAEATARLRAVDPRVSWEATNQAAVHLWYPAPVAPLTGIADAVATWPETATAVAVRRVGAGVVGAGVIGAGVIEVCAPLGLADLLGGVWRRNPRRVTVEQSRARLARHRPAERWPGVAVIPP